MNSQIRGIEGGIGGINTSGMQLGRKGIKFQQEISDSCSPLSSLLRGRGRCSRSLDQHRKVRPKSPSTNPSLKHCFQATQIVDMPLYHRPQPCSCSVSPETIAADYKADFPPLFVIPASVKGGMDCLASPKALMSKPALAHHRKLPESALPKLCRNRERGRQRGRVLASMIRRSNCPAPSFDITAE